MKTPQDEVDWLHGAFSSLTKDDPGTSFDMEVFDSPKTWNAKGRRDFVAVAYFHYTSRSMVLAEDGQWFIQKDFGDEELLGPYASCKEALKVYYALYRMSAIDDDGKR